MVRKSYLIMEVNLGQSEAQREMDVRIFHGIIVIQSEIIYEFPWNFALFWSLPDLCG